MLQAGQEIESVLITGAGYLARGLVAEFLRQDAQRICIYSRNEANQARFRQEIDGDQRVRFFVGDIRDRARLQTAMRGVHVVVHTAALKRVEVCRYNMHEVVQTNVVGTQNVVDAAASAGVLQAVFISSDKAVEATNGYGASKAMGEHIWQGAHEMSLGPNYVTVRYGNVAGSTMSVIPTWRAATGEVELRDPDVTRYWITQQEACDLVVRAIGAKSGDMLIPDLPAYRLGDLAEAMGVRHRITRLEPGEKRHESMRPGESSADARRMTVDELREALKSV